MAVQLPLFPLGVVLFPGAVMPLHIFEPRYRQMLVDCASEDDRFGLCPPSDGRGAPAIGAIGCVAEIVEKQLLPDGRSNILIVGRERFRLMRLVEDGTPYYLGEVARVEDEPGTTPAPDQMAELRRLADEFVALARALTDEPVREAAFAADAVTATLEIASLLEVEFPLRHRLLALRSTVARAELLLDILPQILPQLDAAVQARRRGAGGGDDRPELPFS